MTDHNSEPAAASSVVGRPLQPFKLERFFAKHEFDAKYLLCCSDSQHLLLSELLAMADTDSLHRWENLSLAYTETQGLPELRQEIANRLYASTMPTDVIIGAPQELLSLAMHALVHPGDEIICTMPGYQSLYEIAIHLGATVTPWFPELKHETGEFHFDVQQLKHLLDSAKQNKNKRPVSMVVVNFPHNPTGYLPSQEDWEILVDLCRHENVYLFSDEMYRYLEFNPSDRLASAVDCYTKAVTLSGLSKTVGLPGLRVGWLCCKDHDFLEKVLILKDYSTICTAAPSEVLALIAVRSFEKILSRQLAIILDNLNSFETFLTTKNVGRNLIEWRRPKAGTVCFPRLLRLKPGLEIGSFCEDLVKRSSVLLLPATVYVDDGGEDGRGGGAKNVFEHRFRLGFGRSNFNDCLEEFEKGLIDMYADYFD